MNKKAKTLEEMVDDIMNGTIDIDDNASVEIIDGAFYGHTRRYEKK